MYEFLGSPILNAAGQTVFNAQLTGPTINHTNNQGLWATDANGITTLIAREGDLFDINDDPLTEELLTIDFINWLGNTIPNEGQVSTFNNTGQLAFRLGFTDGTSGIFVANTRLPGDLNGDGFVGIDDLTTVLNNWNQNVTPGDLLAGDANGDGFVGIDDLNTLLPNWNAGTPPQSSARAHDAGSTTPEPASLLIFTGLLGLLNRRV